MPEEGSILVPFLKNALETGKYRNLIYEDPINEVFSLYLPRKTGSLDINDEVIFKDWRDLFDKDYIFSEDYSVAKQNMTQSLRRSDYVELIDNSDNKLTCRILSGKEVAEIKKQKKGKKRQRPTEEPKGKNASYKMAKKRLKMQSTKILVKLNDIENVPSVESGYETTLSSSESCMSDEENDKGLLQSIEHDHTYISTLTGKECKGMGNMSNIGNENCLNADFNDIPQISDDLGDSIEDLFKIPNEQLIRASAEELQLLQQVLDSLHAKAERKKLYICKGYELFDFGRAVILFCKLFQMDDSVADSSSHIIFEEAVLEEIQGYNFVENLIFVEDNHLNIILRMSIHELNGEQDLSR